MQVTIRHFRFLGFSGAQVDEKDENEKWKMENDEWKIVVLTLKATQSSQTEVCATLARSMDG